MILALLVIAPASAETDCDYHNAVSVDPLLEPECAESEQQDDAVKYKGDNKGTTDKRSYLKLTNGEGFTPIAEPTGAIVDETPMLEAALRKEQSWKNKQTFWDRTAVRDCGFGRLAIPSLIVKAFVTLPNLGERDC